MGGRNPNWSREETLLALDLYLRHRPRLLDDEHVEVVELSDLLHDLAEKRGVTGQKNFRNPNGVAMKLGNLSSHDPLGPAGRKGLKQGAKGLEAKVWEEFGDRPGDLAMVVEALRASLEARSDDRGDRGRANPRPRIFVTGMWGFNPSQHGYVGFTSRAVRDRFIDNFEPSDLMMVVGQQGEFSQKGDVGRVLGLVDLTPAPIHESERMSAESYVEKKRKFDEFRWQHAMPIARAWEFSSAVKAKFAAPVTCAPANARAIGATYLKLTEEEAENVLAARMHPVAVYGADEWNASFEVAAIARPGREAVSRGPAPSYGAFSMNREDGPTALYVMVLEGCVDALFPDRAPSASRQVVAKIGMSSEPARRLDEMNSGFPPGAAAGWHLKIARRYPNGQEAYSAEQRFLKYLKGRDMTIGGEFAIIPERELDTLILMYVDGRVGVLVA